MCGAGAARAAYRAAAHLYNTLDRDAASALHALPADLAADDARDAEAATLQAAALDDAADVAAADVAAPMSPPAAEVKAPAEEPPEEAVALMQQRGEAQSGLLRLYRGWAGMEYSLGYVVAPGWLLVAPGWLLGGSWVLWLGCFGWRINLVCPALHASAHAARRRIRTNSQAHVERASVV